MTREEASKILYHEWQAFLEECVDYGGISEAYKIAIKALEQEQNAGHWECNELFYNGESRGAIITCSKCGNEFKVSPKVFENLYRNERFCNHCGARMESEVSECQGKKQLKV